MVEERTRPDRTRLADASNRVTQAQRRRDDAFLRLHVSGRRGRRQARRELAVVDDRPDQVRERFEFVERDTAPAVAVYETACHDARQASDAIRDHDLLRQFDAPHDHALEARISALETWRRWAEGEPVNIDAFVAAAETLNDPRVRMDTNAYRVLGDVITHWPSDSGLQLRLVATRAETLPPAGLGLSL